MREERGGNWNRAGRRSGGDRPTEIVLVSRELTESEKDEERKQAILRGVRAGSPIDTIVAGVLAGIGEQWAADALREKGVRFS
jgi:hypothetical protein